jgi:hypothetical protein
MESARTNEAGSGNGHDAAQQSVIYMDLPEEAVADSAASLPDPDPASSRKLARQRRMEECEAMEHPWQGQPDHIQLKLKAKVMKGRRPERGWKRETGVKAAVVKDYARSAEMQAFRLCYQDPDAVTTQMLVTNYRQRLLAQLERAEDLTALSAIGRLLEKLPDNSAPPEQSVDDSLNRLEQLCRSTELLIERVRESEGLLCGAAEADPEAGQ